MTLAYLPSPERSVWYLGPFPVRAYAMAILLGVVAAVIIGDRRWRARGGQKGTVADLATIVVPAGIVGARLYHVVTSPSAYLDDPVSALYIWEGGLGIPGGIAGGALAAVVLARRRALSPTALVDALAPALPVAQAIGRLGNWFNQELFGRPTTLPWGVEIDPDNPDAVPGAEAYHPTFLYEATWNLLLAAALVWADRRWRLGGGRVFALYVVGYATGRFWVESLRIDDSEEWLGLRLNQWVSLVAIAAALVFLWLRRGAGREAVVERVPAELEPALDQVSDAGDDAPPHTSARRPGPTDDGTPPGAPGRARGGDGTSST